MRLLAQRGNILFLILLAVVLFAALSYAVTQSMRGGGKNANAEKLKTAASDMLAYFSGIDTAYMRMTTTGGLSATQISWENTAWQKPDNSPLIAPNEAFGGATTACPEDRCRIFSAAGGGQFAKVIDTPYLSTTPHSGLKNGSAFINSGVTVMGLGTSLPEYTLIYQRVSREFCVAFNDAAGIGNLTASCPPRATSIWSGELVANGAVQVNSQYNFCIHVSTTADCTLASQDGVFYLVHVVQAN